MVQYNSHYISCHRKYETLLISLLWVALGTSPVMSWMMNPNPTTHRLLSANISPSSRQCSAQMLPHAILFQLVRRTSSYHPRIILRDQSEGEKGSPDLCQEQSPTQLLNLLRPSPKRDVTQISPTSLAYIGDAVYELYVRNRYVWPSRRTSQLQQLVVGKVRAEAQSILLKQLIESSFPLTKQEQNVLSRGRNAGSSSGGRKSRPPKRFTSKSVNPSEKGNNNGPAVYQDATALEALIGYAYLTSDERCSQILQFCGEQLDAMDEEGS